MKSMATQILLVVLAVIFLFKGGLVLLASAWKLVAALSLLGGGYYFVKKALASSGGELSGRKDTPKMKTAASATGKKESAVIEICPYCHSEVGSCAKCRS